jgi:transposase
MVRMDNFSAQKINRLAQPKVLPLIKNRPRCRTSFLLMQIPIPEEPGWRTLKFPQMKAVTRCLARKERRVPVRIGIDEKSAGKDHNYESIVCDRDRGTVESVVDDRKQESLESYFRQFAEEELSQIKAIAMEMCDPYVLATQACVPEAAKKIVFDRFHATKQVTSAGDKVRREEHKELSQRGDFRRIREGPDSFLEVQLGPVEGALLILGPGGGVEAACIPRTCFFRAIWMGTFLEIFRSPRQSSRISKGRRLISMISEIVVRALPMSPLNCSSL